MYSSSLLLSFSLHPRLLSVAVVSSLPFRLQNNFGRYYALLSKAWLAKHVSPLIQELRVNLRSSVVVFSVLQHRHTASTILKLDLGVLGFWKDTRAILEGRVGHPMILVPDAEILTAERKRIYVHIPPPH
jgi:hypothetical protein